MRDTNLGVIMVTFLVEVYTTKEQVFRVVVDVSTWSRVKLEFSGKFNQLEDVLIY